MRPRDMIGYGATPPNPRWPGANIAVQFVLNYQEGAESSVLHGNPASDHFSPKSSARSRFPTGT